MPREHNLQESLETSEHWNRLSNGERIALGKTIASRLAGDWEASSKLCGKRKLAEVIHQPTGLRFVAVPGGACELGMRASEVELGATIEWQEEDTAPSSSTARAVAIRPFLCARTPVLAAQTRALLAIDPDVVGDEDSETAAVRFSPKQAIALLTAIGGAGFRFLSGDEWEYVARDAGANAFINGATAKAAERACSALYAGAFEADVEDEGQNGLGVWGMPWGEWIASPDYARLPGKTRGGAAMLYPWQSDELLMCFAGMGDDMGGFDRNCVRFAIDLL